MELLAVCWVAALIAYFGLTTPRQRENVLLGIWTAMAATALLAPIAHLVTRLL